MIFLPPSGPDFNPIDNVFSKLKAIMPRRRCSGTMAMFCKAEG
jgi:transposase